MFADIRSQTSLNRHPSVWLGERTEQDVDNEFEITFLTFHTSFNNGDENAMVSKEEFFNYFRILSVLYPID